MYIRHNAVPNALPFISKLTKSVAANQMQTDMSVNHMYSVFQSAYRKQHSTVNRAVEGP